MKAGWFPFLCEGSLVIVQKHHEYFTGDYGLHVHRQAGPEEVHAAEAGVCLSSLPSGVGAQLWEVALLGPGPTGGGGGRRDEDLGHEPRSWTYRFGL